MQPRVSIIIPTYNRASFLGRAIESVLSQSYTNCEVIVVDDASDDDTKSVLAPFMEKISYRYLDQNKGQAHARNTGMKMAGGDYIAFLDSDDEYLPFKIEAQVALMQECPQVGMVYTEFSGVREGAFYDEFHLRKYHNFYDYHNLRYKDMFRKKGELSLASLSRRVPYYAGSIFPYVLKGLLIPGPTILFRKSILEKTGFQNEAYRIAEEYEFTTRICKYCEVALLDLPTYIHHYHDNQATPIRLGKSLRKNILPREIEMYRNLLDTVVSLAYNDKDYYGRNRALVDARLAELHHQIGLRNLEHGESYEARRHFRDSYDFSPNVSKFLKYWLFSFLPFSIRNIVYQRGYRVSIVKTEDRLRRILEKDKIRKEDIHECV